MPVSSGTIISTETSLPSTSKRCSGRIKPLPPGNDSAAYLCTSPARIGATFRGLTVGSRSPDTAAATRSAISSAVSLSCVTPTGLIRDSHRLSASFFENSGSVSARCRSSGLIPCCVKKRIMSSSPPASCSCFNRSSSAVNLSISFLSVSSCVSNLDFVDSSPLSTASMSVLFHSFLAGAAPDCLPSKCAKECLKRSCTSGPPASIAFATSS
mmetsp:Transcript_35951/g.81861  ORF Transcript_35951/g.81861 Transcript_35951/m.81861 type:complete len:212 (-) Transcript_35951:170-805(-)